MINGLEGIPGSGKSYEAVAMHVLPTLARGRKVITNLPLLVHVIEAINPDYVGLVELRLRSQPVLGIWDANAIDERGNGHAYKLVDIRHFEPIQNVPVFGSVWDYYSEWKHPTSGEGPLIIIDEAHLALPAVGINQEVVEWFKLHRHFNVDVLLATQSFRDINQPVARLIALLIKCRKGDILGKKDEYIRKVHAGYRGAVISTEQRKYKPEIFQLYRSHTQGNSVAESAASDVAPLSVKLRRWTICAWLVAGAFCVYAFWPKAKHVDATPSPVAASVATAGSARPPVASGALPVSAAAASAPRLAEPPDLEPLRDKLVHITGWIKGPRKAFYSFAASAAGITQFPLSLADLQAAGYTFQPFGDCMGYLIWKTKTRTVTCDAPVMAVGSNNAPVVMDAGTGRSSAEALKSGKAL